MSRKVFTAGEVLAAADVNSFLMDQTVMSFAGTAARGSAIPSPVEGMYTHLEDTDRLQFWNGSAWVSPFGATLVGSTTVTAGTSVTLSNIFSSEFDNYQVLIRLVNTAATRTAVRLVAGATIYNGADYPVSVAFGTSSITNESTTGSDFVITASTTTAGGSYGGHIMIYSPFLSQQTSYTSYVVGAPVSGGGIPQRFNSAGYFNGTQSIDGLNFSVSTGTFTGTIRVYGMRN